MAGFEVTPEGRAIGYTYVDTIQMKRKTCDSLWEDYRNARARELETLLQIIRQSKPLSRSENRDLLFRQVTQSEMIWQELLEHHCIPVSDQP